MAYNRDSFVLPEAEEAEPPPLKSPFDEEGEGKVDEAEAALERRRARLAEAGITRPHAEPRKKRSLIWLGWLVFLALAGAVIYGGYKARKELVAIYPPLAKLYEKLHIPVEPSEWLGLELRSLKSAVVIDNAQTKIEVSGEVVNLTEEARLLPPIRVSMRGSAGNELAAYTLTLDERKVGGKGTVSFSVRLPGQKEDVTDLEVAFAPPP